MTEQVIRHRGAVRDENGEITPAEPDLPLTPIVVAPGGGSEYSDRFRDGESLACIVYFPPGTDVVNSDRMTVRGQPYGVIVNDWLVSERGIVEVLCTRGQG